MRHCIKEFKVGDLFCGAGGSSEGAKKAIEALNGHMTLVCVNHWPVAIETHKRNHPEAQHYVEDVSTADPYEIVPGLYLDLLMASPECRFYSRARGGRPVHDQGRMNPWAILKWLTAIRVRSLLVENVPEFINWGPLLDDGRPDPRHKGEYFQAWFFAIQKAGYRAEWRMLNAADYGDATTRTRFFLIARRDKRPIVWPAPTHAEKDAVTMLASLPKWRAAREIIDWDNTGRSLLDDPKYQKRPLSDKTLRRIARGLQKFGGVLAPLYIRALGLEPDGNGNGDGEALPFVMGKESSPAYRNINQPINTLTADGRPVLVEAMTVPYGPRAEARSIESPLPTILTKDRLGVASFVLGQQSDSSPRNTSAPIPTIATHGAISLVKPLMVKYYGTGICHTTDEPVPTLTTKERIGLATAFMVPNRLHGERRGQNPRTRGIDKPVPTITSHGGGNLVNPILVEVNHGGEEDRSRSPDAPLGTVTGKRGTALVSPFVVQWDQTGGNGSYVRSIDSPIPTIVTKKTTGITLGLAEPILRRIEAGDIDPRRLVIIDDEPYQLDIRFRMLTNMELARAMGFSDAESTYEFVGNASEVTQQIGNAVPVNLARALVAAILQNGAKKGE